MSAPSSIAPFFSAAAVASSPAPPLPMKTRYAGFTILIGFFPPFSGELELGFLCVCGNEILMLVMYGFVLMHVSCYLVLFVELVCISICVSAIVGVCGSSLRY